MTCKHGISVASDSRQTCTAQAHAHIYAHTHARCCMLHTSTAAPCARARALNKSVILLFLKGGKDTPPPHLPANHAFLLLRPYEPNKTPMKIKNLTRMCAPRDATKRWARP